MEAITSAVPERSAGGLTAEIMGRHGIPGAVVVTISEGELSSSCALGVVDGANAAPVQVNSAFRIGRVGKLFLALGLLHLVDDGRIRLGDLVGDFLSDEVDHRGLDPRVSVRHLLLATSMTSTSTWHRRFSTRTHDHVDRRTAGRRGSDPSDRRDRDETAATAAIITTTTGETLPAFIGHTVFGPLRMRSSAFLGDAATSPPSFGRRLGPELRDPDPHPTGTALSSPADLGRLVVALATPGHQLPPSLLSRMFPASALLPAPGLGFWMTSVGGHRLAIQVFGTPGFVAGVAVAPDDRAGVVVAFPAPIFPNWAQETGALTTKIMVGLLDLEPETHRRAH